jgi:shikimate 5-dehydrogenase
VTHPAIKRKDSRSENFLITAQEAMRNLYQMGSLDSLNFFTFGAHVNYSLTPMMHSLAYEQLGMTHEFYKYTASSLDELAVISQDPRFGGAGISQPFKVEIMSRCVAHSRHAKAIGASNTIIPLRALPDGSAHFLLTQANQRLHSGPVRAWFGDNTDFLGILTCLRRNASPRNVVQPSKTTGLVIGAGGMARATIYAMILLGCRNIFIYNRTVANAETVANHFNSWAGALSKKGSVVTVLRSRDEAWPAEYQQPTFLVSCVPAHMVVNQPAADFEVPEQWLGSLSGGVALEVCYSNHATVC